MPIFYLTISKMPEKVVKLVAGLREIFFAAAECGGEIYIGLVGKRFANLGIKAGWG